MRCVSGVIALGSCRRAPFPLLSHEIAMGGTPTCIHHPMMMKFSSSIQKDRLRVSQLPTTTIPCFTQPTATTGKTQGRPSMRL
ncbi:hypothetical protein M408DRAFT_146280 [Serendipita vermifera MAFF 305830]|uniref:Uncharacterized protein n=1 Tax=Serendipita vermifera MAFF 305830 TaxID=933852 RepID=A0A0C3A6C3_SERVB|nr:hypothetical protein M408DRAFT_146280 [Serendipita vermifera MAFF 305830]